MNAGPFETQDQAISAWNRRTTDECVARLVEAANQLCDAIDDDAFDYERSRELNPYRFVEDMRAAIAAYRAAHEQNRAVVDGGKESM